MKIKLYMCGGERPESGVPLGIGYLLTNCPGASVEYVRDRHDLRDCDLIGLSATACGIPEAINILTSTQIPVIIGGQATLWEGLKDYPFSYLVSGDGEPALQEILFGHPEREIISEQVILDDLNFPERGELYSGKVPMMTSRGCPFHCAFCSSSEYWGTTRYISAERFIAEVGDILANYKDASWLYIMDDLFVADRKRFNHIHDLWMSGGYNKKLRLWSFVRAGVFDLDMAKKMKEMGFKSVRFGAESGSDRILKVLHKNTTVEMNQTAVDAAASAGLWITGSFMHHTPTETDEERAMTLKFIEKNRGKMGVEGYYQFRAFPGTEFYAGESPITTDMRVR